MLQRTPARIWVERLAFSVAALGVGGDAAMFFEFVADCWVVKSTFFASGAVTSGVEAA